MESGAWEGTWLNNFHIYLENRYVIWHRKFEKEVLSQDLILILVFSNVALVVKNLPAAAGGARDVGLIPVLGRSPGVGNDNPLQYSCLENSMDKRSLVGYIVHGLTELYIRVTEHTHIYTCVILLPVVQVGSLAVLLSSSSKSFLHPLSAYVVLLKCVYERLPLWPSG